MLALLPLLLAVGPFIAPQDEGIELHEPISGATLTLPADWSFATGEEGLMAASADERAFVLLAGAEGNFEALREDVRALILARLDDVTIAKTTIEGINERGAIEEIVKAIGKGTSKKDGAPVEFAGFLIRSGDDGVLVLGAWKDADHAEIVGQVLAGLHVKETAGEGGLEIKNPATGASVKIPKGWEVLRTRKGLLANCPHGNAMAILMNWQDDFEQSLEKIRGALLGWVFKEVEIGEFGVVEASYDKSLGRVVAASGTAIHRQDGKPVVFTVLRIQRVDTNEGAVLFGVWKDEKHAEEVAALMTSIRLAEPKKE